MNKPQPEARDVRHDQRKQAWVKPELGVMSLKEAMGGSSAAVSADGVSGYS
jgi:hypothetical protein